MNLAIVRVGRALVDEQLDARLSPNIGRDTARRRNAMAAPQSAEEEDGRKDEEKVGVEVDERGH